MSQSNSVFDSVMKVLLGAFALAMLATVATGLYLGSYWAGIGLVLLMTSLIGNVAIHVKNESSFKFPSEEK